MTTNEADSGRPAWRFVILLTILNAISYIDRHSMALLAQPISTSLGLSDTDLALIIGAGFAFVYALVSLPLSNVIDRWNRTLIVAIAVALWSGATILAGFAHSFTMLAIARAGVALGEAALVPAAVSLIADLFPPDKRIAPMSLFSSVAGIMGKAAFVVGAGLLTLATIMAPRFGLEPWRITLVLMGAPGIALALLLIATMREPARKGEGEGAARPPEASLGTFLRHVGRNAAFYVPLYIGISAIATFAIGMISWTPTLLVRGHGFETAQAGFLFGMIGMTAGLVGTVVWPWLVARLRRKGRIDAILINLAASSAVLAPFAIFGPLSSGAMGLLVGVAGVQFAFAAVGVLTPLVAQNHGPPSMRARLMSVQLIAMSLIGFTLGPLSVAEFAKLWDGNPLALGYGMAALGAIVAPVAIISFILSRRALIRNSASIHG